MKIMSRKFDIFRNAYKFVLGYQTEIFRKGDRVPERLPAGL